MLGLFIAGGILLAVIVLLSTRVGAAVCFDQAGLSVRVKAGPFRITVFPAKKETKRGKHPADEKKHKKKEKPEEDEKPGAGGKWDMLMLYVRIGVDAAGRMRRKLRIDKLHIDLVWAATDPAAAALGYGYMTAALSALLPMLEKAFDVRGRRVRTSVDFEGTSPTVSVAAECSMTVGQGLMFALAALMTYLKGKKKIKKEAMTT